MLALLAVAAVVAGCGAAAPSEPGGAPVPTAGPGSGDGAARVVPLPAGRFDYQIGGAYPPAPGVAVVARDRRDRPAPGTYSVCYVNAFQTQPAETAWWRSAHPELLLRTAGGELVGDPDWPGEVLLDVSTPARRTAVAGIVGGWIDGCAAAGFRAVEPDNLDSWTRSGGRLTRADALATATLLAARAHAAGLAIGQKNAAELGSAGRAAGLDFAVAEECEPNAECDAYTGAYGRAVVEVEYTERGFRAACAARAGRVAVVLRDRDVAPAGAAGHRSEWC